MNPHNILKFPLKLKIGRTYLRRDGETITIDKYQPEAPFPYIDSAHGNGYRADGVHAPNILRRAYTCPLTGRFHAAYTELEPWNVVKEIINQKESL